jgi:predicted phosphodiesterase
MSRIGGRSGQVRVAVFSDIHGNVVALDAVIQGAIGEGIDEYWCLGDLVAHGPRPVEVVARLRDLGNLKCVRGNTDRYVLTGDLGGIIPPIDRPRTARAWRDLADARESFAWTRGCLVAGGHAGWLAGLPLEQRVNLPDGTRVLLVHSSPGRDDGPGLSPGQSDEALVQAGFTKRHADLVLVGHTHVRCERDLGGCRVVNPGPVSLPRRSDDQARWAVLEASNAGYAIEHRTVPYDLAGVVDDLSRQRHPAGRWLASKMTKRR